MPNNQPFNLHATDKSLSGGNIISTVGCNQTGITISCKWIKPNMQIVMCVHMSYSQHHRETS